MTFAFRLHFPFRQVFSIGAVAAYSAKYSDIVEYKIQELFQY